MKEIIYIGPTIFTNDPEKPLLSSGAVVVKNDAIVAIGDADEIRRAHPNGTVENIGPGLLTPGLVNLHHHLYSAFARGWNPPGGPPSNFPEILERVWWRLDSALNLDDIYFSALLGLCESVQAGVTSVVDHHSSQGAVSGSLDMVAAAFDKVGISGSICFELTDRAGEDVFALGLKESLWAIDKWNKPGGRLSAMLGMHASMTLSDESLETISRAASGLDVGYHFHLAEDRSDQDNAVARHGRRATERFAEFGLLNEKSLAIHGVHLDESEVRLLRENKVNLVICPRSNQNNAVGFPAWWHYGDLKFGLGTDGIGSDMLGEAMSAIYLSRHQSGDPNLAFGTFRKILLENNTGIFENITGIKTGSLSPGLTADMVLWNYDPPTPLNSDNIWGHYIYGLSGLRASSVWAAGRRILKDGLFTEFEYDEIACRARGLAKALWERI